MGDFASLGAKHRLHGGNAAASFSFPQVQHHPSFSRNIFFVVQSQKEKVAFAAFFFLHRKGFERVRFASCKRKRALHRNRKISALCLRNKRLIDFPSVLCYNYFDKSEFAGYDAHIVPKTRYGRNRILTCRCRHPSLRFDSSRFYGIPFRCHYT